MKLPSTNPKDWARSAVIDDNGRPKENFQRMIEKAIDIQRPFVVKHVRELRAKHPTDSPQRLLERLEDQYMLAVTAGGAAVGATAFVPGVGTVASMGLSAAATVGFLEASALFAQAVAEVHGVQLRDPEKARALVMGVMLGEESGAMLAMLGRGGNAADHWGNILGSSQSGISSQIMAQIRRRFLQRFLTRQGAGFLGRMVPFGIGAAIGGVGNRVMGKAVVKASKEAFGPAPVVIPGELQPTQAQIAKVEEKRSKEKPSITKSPEN